MLEQSELDDSNYMSFVAMLNQYGRRDVFDAAARRLPRVHAGRTTSSIAALLGHLVEPLRTPSHHAGDGARSCTPPPTASGPGRRDKPVLPFAVALGDLVDGMVGFLAAPVSAATREALERADPASVSRHAGV